MTAFRTLGLLLALTVLAPQLALAQAAPAAPATKDDDPDRDFNRSQPDFVVINLPTTLRVPKFKSAFRVTHRFGRPLGQGSFGNLAEDLFGLDSGAQIGLEYRFGLMRGLQVGIHRTSDRTIEFFTQYSLLQQADHGVGLGVIASIDGTNNFKDSYTPMIGVALSRELGRYGAVYVEPMYVNNSNLLPSELVDDNDTFMVGLGARIRVRPTVNIVAEFIPRSGNTPGVNHGTFGIEKVVGGHTFQLNFSDGFGTTMGQLARGGTAKDNWYLGFNISRKFF
ncbi:MAG TPA: DUF5777 family beta-barrel protein [Vicinamibacterales bacterium]|jgi:hypothetical protein|nr:DUF5777 family beta-barrel protein [Vicinamibacterales bacterium]